MDVPNQVEGNSMRMWHPGTKPPRLWLSYMQGQISKHPIPRSYSTHPRNHRLAEDWKVYIYIWNHRTPIYIIILYIPYIRICHFSWLNPPKKMLKFPFASLSNDSGPQSADNDFGLLQRWTPKASLGSCHGVSTAAICFMLYDHGRPINWSHTSVLSQSLFKGIFTVKFTTHRHFQPEQTGQLVHDIPGNLRVNFNGTTHEWLSTIQYNVQTPKPQPSWKSRCWSTAPKMSGKRGGTAHRRAPRFRAG